MECIKKFKFELIVCLIFSSLSIIYYLDTGEVRILGVLLVAFYALFALVSVFIKLFKKMSEKHRAHSMPKKIHD
ncbi:hypothetical protein CW748_10190 [Alteromonadales bacterium alter-6D02]|nr:hypothetical protein CW748_10190 [Alteromonadales bacterium alter-6D02]